MSRRVNSPEECADLKPSLRRDLFSELAWNLNTGTHYFFAGLLTPRVFAPFKRQSCFTYNSEPRFTGQKEVEIIKPQHKHGQIPA